MHILSKSVQGVYSRAGTTSRRSRLNRLQKTVYQVSNKLSNHFIHCLFRGHYNIMNRLCRVRILYSGEKRTFVMLCSSSPAVDCQNSTIDQQVLSSKHTLQVDNLNYINPFRSWVSEVAVHYFSVCTMREGGRSRTVFLYLVYSS